jgi:hypothetical protein
MTARRLAFRQRDLERAIYDAKSRPTPHRVIISYPGDISVQPVDEDAQSIQPESVSRVYLIQSGPFVKIGTTRDIATRIADLQRATPFPLTLLAILAGDVKLERELHRRFDKQRHRFEWFRIEGELEDWINEGCK